MASGLTIGSGTTPAFAACKARNLKATATLRIDLAAAHKKVDNSYPDSGPSKVYYGTCGSTYYALGTFKDPQLGTTDQPEIFSHKRGKAWKDLGDSGGDLGVIPDPLLKAWHLSAQGRRLTSLGLL